MQDNNDTLMEILSEVRALKRELRSKNQLAEKKIAELTSLIENIRFSVSSVVAKYDEFGNPSIKVHYSIEPKEIKCDEFGKPIYPSFIIAANKLNLVSFEDMQKISQKVNNLFCKKDS